ncbi:pectate lyase [Winogradskya humida]|uniref:Pectate lyase n=1 Tax=Winogradskya humida TaxID=113566 RepID=A0ABQ3ZXQ7_9ACTN|nr:pectate lyase [Actinoplanes humidus]GIE23368.1 pectate lyase [Actinoplanes humidus]
MAQRSRRTTRLIAAGAVALAAVAATVTTQFASAAESAETVTATIQVDGVFDGAGKRFIADGALGDGGQDEGQDAMFELADGATLTNVILGVPAADGVHCLGSCTLRDVTWEDVGEDAATFLGTNATVLVEGGSAALGTDKVFQDNRLAGGSVTIKNFTVSDFGKLYRSCGNCDEQAARTVSISNVTATGTGKVLAGVNGNLGDKVTITDVTLPGATHVCEIFEGNDTGAEPTKVATEPDGVTCVATGITVQ